MNTLLERFTSGDLRSDIMASEVAAEVINDLSLLPDLTAGLNEKDPVVRARTADALEKVTRQRPGVIKDKLPTLVRMALTDPVPMVRWHMAMIFSNLDLEHDEKVWIVDTLIQMLGDISEFVKNWTISSLCILGRQLPELREKILDNVKYLEDDDSMAVRSRVQHALACLEDVEKPLPTGWSKSDAV